MLENITKIMYEFWGVTDLPPLKESRPRDYGVIQDNS